MIQVSWSELKDFLTARSLSAQYVTIGASYFVVGVDGPFMLSAMLPLDESNSETADFVANFKPSGNSTISLRDADGATLSRNKTTRAGWHFEPRSIDFTTGVGSSMYNRKHNGNTISEGTDYGDAALLFFDASGAAITQNGETLAEWQARLDAQCVRTQMDWQPVYDMDIIGGSVSVLAAPESPHQAYMWIIGACDIPEEFGGSVPFMAGGYNCKHFKTVPILSLDGRGVYFLPYDPVNNSNKIRVVFKHTLGCKMEMQFVADHFKA